MTSRASLCLIGLGLLLAGCSAARVGTRSARSSTPPVEAARPALARTGVDEASGPALAALAPDRKSTETRPASRTMANDSASPPSIRVVSHEGESDSEETVEQDAASAGEEANADEMQVQDGAKDHTLTLGNVMYLADARNPNVAVARERIQEAYARVERADTLWIPSLRAGLNYNHHEGAIQDVAGTVFNTTRSSFYGGLGANAVGAGSPAVPGLVAQFHLTDAIFQPGIAAHQASARQFGAAAARNNTLRDAAVAYLELVRAEHALAIAREALENTENLTDLTRQYAATGQGLQSDHQRLEAELALRQEDLVAREEGVQVASARLAQVLHADPSVPIASGEPTVIPLEIVSLEGGAASYVATGLSRRPELAEQKHLVCEAVERLERERYAPLVPSVLLGMSYGCLGGGLGSAIVNTNDRWDADAVAYWEIRNLGFGERAARGEARSQQRQAQMREVALLDGVAREVVESHAQVVKRRQRIELARRGVEAAHKSYTLNVQRIENAQGLPIETLQAIQALANAQRAYLNAVVDYNVAQFELSRAVGWFVET